MPTRTRDPGLAQKAIAGVLNEVAARLTPSRTRPDTLNEVEEAPEVSTMGAAQTGLTTIEVLELCRTPCRPKLRPISGVRPATTANPDPTLTSCAPRRPSFPFANSGRRPAMSADVVQPFLAA